MQVDLDRIRIHAAEARGLRDDPAYRRAISAIRERWLEELATIDPLDTEKLRTLQSSLRAIHALDGYLADEISRGSDRRAVSVA